MERPRLKAHFLTEVVDGSKVFLLAEGQHFLVQGAAAVAVLPHLDGRHAVGEIVGLVGAETPFPETLLALRKYQAAGHLAEGRPQLPDGALAFWDARGIDPAAVVAGSQTTELTLVGSPAVDVIKSALQDSGLRARLVSPDEAIALTDDGIPVGLVDDYLDPLLP